MCPRNGSRSVRASDPCKGEGKDDLWLALCVPTGASAAARAIREPSTAQTSSDHHCNPSGSSRAHRRRQICASASASGNSPANSSTPKGLRNPVSDGPMHPPIVPSGWTTWARKRSERWSGCANSSHWWTTYSSARASSVSDSRPASAPPPSGNQPSESCLVKRSRSRVLARPSSPVSPISRAPSAWAAMAPASSHADDSRRPASQARCRAVSPSNSVFRKHGDSRSSSVTQRMTAACKESRRSLHDAGFPSPRKESCQRIKEARTHPRRKGASGRSRSASQSRAMPSAAAACLWRVLGLAHRSRRDRAVSGIQEVGSRIRSQRGRTTWTARYTERSGAAIRSCPIRLGRVGLFSSVERAFQWVPALRLTTTPPALSDRVATQGYRTLQRWM